MGSREAWFTMFTFSRPADSGKWQEPLSEYFIFGETYTPTGEKSIISRSAFDGNYLQKPLTCACPM
jgi:hypothetical protein